MKEVENILDILKNTMSALNSKDYIKLKELSDRTIHTASVTQDPDNIAIAVIVYSLSKIIERRYNENPKGERFIRLILEAIDKSIKSVQEGDYSKLRFNLELIRISIDKLSPEFKRNIQDVFRKASINKASKIYEHGISMEKTANLLGITLYELAGYSGQKTTTTDIPETKTISAKDRIKLVMEMFE